MILCPSCGAVNIEGSDFCEDCEQPLTDQHLREPTTSIERDLLNDHIPTLHPTSPIAVSSRAPVGEVLQLLVQKRIGCVVVVDDGALVGIFSERDALRRLGPDAVRLGHRPVAEFMTQKVESLQDSAKIAFAVQRMDLGGYRHIPIVDEKGDPTGIISARDILRYLADRIPKVER